MITNFVFMIYSFDFWEATQLSRYVIVDAANLPPPSSASRAFDEKNTKSICVARAEAKSQTKTSRMFIGHLGNKNVLSADLITVFSNTSLSPRRLLLFVFHLLRILLASTRIRICALT